VESAVRLEASPALNAVMALLSRATAVLKAAASDVESSVRLEASPELSAVMALLSRATAVLRAAASALLSDAIALFWLRIEVLSARASAVLWA
jgi:hypothetical protein